MKFIYTSNILKGIDMKRLSLLFLFSSLISSGCSYAGVALSADGKRAVIAKNTHLFGGLFRQVYVCKVTNGGLTECHSSTSP